VCVVFEPSIDFHQRWLITTFIDTLQQTFAGLNTFYKQSLSTGASFAYTYQTTCLHHTNELYSSQVIYLRRKRWISRPLWPCINFHRGTIAEDYNIYGRAQTTASFFYVQKNTSKHVLETAKRVFTIHEYLQQRHTKTWLASPSHKTLLFIIGLIYTYT